jgi:thioredoxin:protein disulfide reductase
MNKWLLLILLLLPLGLCAQPQPLPAEKAFAMKVYLEKSNQLKVEWTIAPEYYLYRNKIHFSFSPISQVQGGDIVLPPGKEKHDEINGAYQIYSGKFAVFIPLISPVNGVLNLNIFYQGCSSGGFCYVPIKKQLNIDLNKLSAPSDLTKDLSSMDASMPAQEQATSLLKQHKLTVVILGFLGLGILLAFTPCVLPMVPILSGIIVGYHRKDALTTRRAFLLSLSYVLGMALTYMTLGIIVALLGSRIQAYMQTPGVIILFSSFFVILALSLFGFYELHFPRKWQIKIMKWDQHFKRGTYPGVFFMGCFSSLIVSPCVSAPLVGVLAYIAQEGSAIFGALALLALGIGMGIPLLVFGMAAGKFLPKSGRWMQSIQKVMGILMLGMAVWLISRLLPGTTSVLLWGILLVIAAGMLRIFQTVENRVDKFLKIIAAVLFIYGILLIISAELKNKDPLQPWKIFYSQSGLQQEALFMVVKNIEQLNQQFSLAKREKRPIILDFYADWCADCKSMDRKVFNDPDVQEAIKKFILLRADITKNDEFDRSIAKRFHIEGPPAVLFFNSEGKEFVFQRLVGEVSKQDFLTHLREIE